MGPISFEIPAANRDFLAATIASTGGSEVYFLGRVRWDGSTRAILEEVDVFSRGNRSSTPAIIEGAEDWDIAIHNHPGGDLTPSEADVAIAGELGNRRVGFAIIDDRAERSNLVVPPFERVEERPVEAAEVEAIFAPGGVLERAYRERPPGGGAAEGYEVRPGQVAMALEVARAINESGVVALEAGTGIGKSFAYLVPAILWASRNKKRVVVSTNTIHLQEQLIAKDLPFLEKALPVRFTYALIKGRGNYACRRKAAEARPEAASLFPDADSARLLGDLLDWTERTADGSLADLGMQPPEEVWEKVMSETDKSLKVNCPFYRSCFYYEAKRRAFKTDILVVNHHLFFADLAVRRESGNYQWDMVLPGYQRVVFDEAHHLEEVASKHLGVRFSQDGVRRRFARMVSSRDLKKGMLPFLARKLRQEGAAAAADSIENHYIPLLPEIAGRVEEQFTAIARLVEAEAGRLEDGPGAAGGGGGAGEETGTAALQVRLRSDPGSAPFRHTVADRLGAVKKELNLLGRINDRAVRTLKMAPGLEDDRRASLLLDLTALSQRLDRLLEHIDFFADAADETHVRWIDVRAPRTARDRWNVQFATSPIRVAANLREAVYDPLETVVMASATLAVEGKVDFFGGRVGLDLIEPERFRFREYPSPFDFPRQVLTLVPTDFPDPRARPYEDRLAEMLLAALRLLRGRTFILFTSYRLLDRMHARLEGDLHDLGIEPLRQGQANRSELLRRFRGGAQHVLFGTDSFWEGVDVKGRALECVIITRLPFRVPSDPLQLARVEDLQRRGISPFPNFTVPQAVLKFKQGFGRLIRSTSDRGVVLVLDRRLVSQPYGRTFLRSLPPARLVTAPSAAVLKELEQFFKETTIL